MEVQQRAKFSLTKRHHIVLKSTATSYLCGSFKKITILRSFSQGKKKGQKWPYWKAYDMSTIFSCFEELYDGVLWAKTWRAAAPPYPGFRWSKNFSSEIFENFQAQKFFWRKVSRKKFFSRKDVYWVTWLHMKRLGHSACTTWATAAEIAKKAGFGHFWPNPQIGFWAILGRGCVGAGWQHMKKTCEPRLHTP